jgi:hypothetical protein
METSRGNLLTRYCHPECAHFKVVVTFAVKRNLKEQGRVVPSPDDRATNVSTPTIEPLVGDLGGKKCAS